MNREKINRVFRRDYRELLGFDVFKVTDGLEYLIDEDILTRFLPEAVKLPIRHLTSNLVLIVVKYLEYDEEKFPNPLDQYKYIYENRDTILEILARNLKVGSPIDDVISHYIYTILSNDFQRLFDNLVTCGTTHSFDPETIEDFILSDGEESD